MIRVRSWVRHDGKIFRKGDVLETDPEAECRLISLGVAEDCGREVFPEDQEADVLSGDEALSESGKEATCGIPLGDDESLPSREKLEEEYRVLGGLPRDDWSLEKLMSKLEERKGLQ